MQRHWRRFLACNEYGTEPARLPLALTLVIGPALVTWLGIYTRALLGKDGTTVDRPTLEMDPRQRKRTTV